MSNQHPLIGRTIVGLSLSDDRVSLAFLLDGAEVVFARTDGDCCSSTWIEAIDDESVLVGHVVANVEDIDMPHLGNVGTPHHPDVEEVEYYGFRITTDAGSCTIDYRNDSNGYYGGSLVWSGPS